MKHSTRQGWLVGLVAAAGLGGLGAAAEPLLAPGGRMVFIGDSITEQRCYTRYVMDYFSLRYPGADISFRNAGWGGDTAPGGLGRLQRDVLDLKPTVVSICFGMNDGGYGAFNQGHYDRYMAGMTGLVAKLKQSGVKVVLLTPGCVDADRRAPGDVYNDTLTRFAAGVKELAAKEQVPIFDLNALMLDVQRQAKAAISNFTMIPDSVHPSEPGQAVMAYGLLEALGCDGPAATLAIDAASVKVDAERCTVSNLQVTAEAITFTRKDVALPAYFDPPAATVYAYLVLLQDLMSYPFRVTGLKAGNWKLTVQGKDVGTFTADALAAGVNLATNDGPWAAVGADVNRLSAEQESAYFSRWRQIQLADVPAEAKAEQQALLAKLDSLIAAKEQARLRRAADEPAWTWSLTRVP